MRKTEGVWSMRRSVQWKNTRKTFSLCQFISRCTFQECWFVCLCLFSKVFNDSPSFLSMLNIFLLIPLHKAMILTKYYLFIVPKHTVLILAIDICLWFSFSLEWLTISLDIFPYFQIQFKAHFRHKVFQDWFSLFPQSIC